MSDIKFSCRHCGQRLEVQEDGAGMTVPCPTCNGQVIVPLEVSPALPPSLPLLRSRKTKALVFKPTNEFVGKFAVGSPAEISDALQGFCRVTHIPVYSYIEVFGSTWTIVSHAPFRLQAGRVTQPSPTEAAVIQSSAIYSDAAKRNMLFGAAWCLGGIVVTAVTYNAAVTAGGGTYVVAWGAILFGAVQFFMGLVGKE